MYPEKYWVVSLRHSKSASVNPWEERSCQSPGYESLQSSITEVTVLDSPLWGLSILWASGTSFSMSCTQRRQREGSAPGRLAGLLLSGLDSSPPPTHLAELCVVCSLRMEAASSLIIPFSLVPQPACPKLFAPRCLLRADLSAWGLSPSLTPTQAYMTFPPGGLFWCPGAD